MEEIDESGEFEEVGSVGDQWIGKFYGISKQNSICITYQSKTHPGMLYVYNFYRRSKKNALVGSFRCACCRQAYDYAKANDLPPPRVCCVRGTIDYVNKTVNFHEDPDTQRHGDCRRRNPHEVKALKLRGDAKNQIRESGIPGRECVELIQKKVLQKDKNDYEYVLQELGTTETVRRSLKRAARPRYVLNCMPADIDDELQKSNFPNCPPMVRENREDFVFLMEEKGKDIIRKAKYLIFDGTFEKVPPGFEQIYVIVAVYCDYPNYQKSFVCGIVIVKKKDQMVYEELFQILKDQMDGDMGVEPKEFRFDHEMAAINGAKAVFPEYTIKTCNWHYTRNLRDYAKSSKCSIHLHNDPAFQRWLRTLMGTSHLPLRWMEVVVDYLLSHPPRQHPLLEAPMNEFIGYYRRQWRGKLRFINYYDTEGPRTTNACEAFNSSLNFKHKCKRRDDITCCISVFYHFPRFYFPLYRQ